MSAFDTATKFFHACESLKGWAGCREFVADGAGFTAQADALAGVTTVEAYCEWMKGIGGPMPDARYELHSAAWDEGTRTALYFATFIGTHTVQAGPPIPPTNKQARSHYVYALTMNAAGKVEKMTKIWNSGWAMNQLGWG